MTASTALLVAAPSVPLVLALAWTAPGLRRHAVALAPWAAVPALILALTPWLSGAPFPAGQAPVLGGLRLGLDSTGHPFLLLTAVLWVAAGAFARSYHAGDGERDSFFVLFLLTMGGNVGLVLAGDILSFYTFFVLMAFAAWGLVVHDRTGQAFRAGRVYIVMTVLADLALLAAIFALSTGRGAPGFGAELDAAWAGLVGTGWGPGLTAVLVVVGFGVKAGLLPLHIWLPLAYREAPPAVTALLSGAMMKAAVLAWIRFLPDTMAFPTLAAGLVGLGVAAAFFGVVVGLSQDDARTVLAYSSVSQIGFIAILVGVMARDPGLTTAGAAGATIYALHHGLAKGTLFLSVGAADRVRGSWWRAVTLLAAAVPALAIAGAPLTTGAMAKGILGTATERLGTEWYHALHPLLLVGAFGTTLLLARFLLLLRRRAGRRNDARPPDAGAHTGSRAGLVVPLLLLAATGALGIFWIPRAVSSPGLEVPGPLHAPLEALLPVLTGALVAAAVYRRPGLLGPLARIRIPAGDLVVPMERAAGSARTALSTVFTSLRPERLNRIWDALRTRSGMRLQRLADGDIRWMRGVILATVIAILAGLLVLAGLP